MRRLIRNKSRKLKHSFGASAPKLVVRPEFPLKKYWVLSLLLSFVLGGFLAIALMSMYPEGGDGDSVQLRQRVSVAETEVVKLRSMLGTGASTVQMERAGQQQLLGQIQFLEAENARLKEEKLLFERLATAPVEQGAVRVEGAAVSAIVDGGQRYRFFVAFQPTKQVTEFRGRYQLKGRYRLDNGVQEFSLPERASDAGYQLRFGRFAFKEGEIKIPEGAHLISLTIRLYMGDALSVEQDIKL